MLYKTINIFARNDKWELHIHYNNGEREDTETIPNANGWYHFPSTMPDKEAFKKLRSCMIKAHKKKIQKLEKSLEELKKFKPSF